MVLFTILTIIALFLVAFTILAVAAGGTVFIIIFGDVIVCVMIILWIMKRLIRRKK